MHISDFTHVVTLPIHQTSLSIPSVNGENGVQSTEGNYIITKTLSLGSALACLFTQPLTKHWEKGGTQASVGKVISKEKEQPVFTGYI